MSESEAPKTRLLWIVLTGVVSLAVGILTTVGAAYFTESKPRLVYSVTSAETFPGKTKNLGIVAINVENPGRNEIEELQCHIKLHDAKLTEPRCKGLQPDSYTTKAEADSIVLTAPFLNPGESFSLQLLIEPETEEVRTPEIDIRGKGVSGILDSHETSDFPDSKIPVVLGMITAISLMGASTPLLRKFVKSNPFLRVLDEMTTQSDAALDDNQRDSFALLLGVHGFPAYAAELRASGRRYKWKTLSDMLTERVLNQNPIEQENVANAMKVLQAVLQHSGRIAPSSESILHTNLARLSVARDAETHEDALAHIENARSKNQRVANMRCTAMPDLSQLPPSENV